MEPNVILKYKRPSDSWICPDCDCENKMDNENCFVCSCAKPATPTVISAWSEKDEQPVTKKQPSPQKAPAPKKVSAPKKSPVKPASPTPPRGYAPVVVKEPPKKRTGTKILVVFLTLIIIALIVVAAIYIIKNYGKKSSVGGDSSTGQFEKDENKAKYDEAEKAYSDGDYKKAIELFESLPADYEDVETMLNESRYYYASELLDEDDASKLGEAKSLFEELDDYKDSEEKVQECIYLEATMLMEKGDYLEAKELFESIEGYEDADEQAEYCYYCHAKELYEYGYYEDAEDIFLELGDYEDSIDYIEKCVYARADEYAANNDFVEAMKLVYDHTNGDLNNSKFISIQNSLESYNRSNGYFPEAESMKGNWGSDDGKTLNYTTTDSGTINMNSTMTWTYSSTYTFKNGIHYQVLSSSDEIQWVIQRVTSTNIKLFNYHEGKIYNFTKQ